jgi:hypothetical protein
MKVNHVFTEIKLEYPLIRKLLENTLPILVASTQHAGNLLASGILQIPS